LTEKEKTILREETLGRGIIRCVEAQRAYEVLEKKFNANPLYLLKQRPKYLNAILTIHKITQPPEEKKETSLRLFAFQENHCEKWAWVIVNAREWEPQIWIKIEQVEQQAELPLWIQNKLKPSECALIVGNPQKDGAETSIEILSQFLEKMSLNTLKQKFIFELLSHDISSVFVNNIK
jgi:hypothetical protein